MKRNRIYLVDLENVGRKGLLGIRDLEKADRVYVFHNGTHGTMPDFFGSTKPDCFFKVISLYNHHAQALDLTLAAQFGSLLTKNPGSEFVIISKDRGFESLQGYAKACFGMTVKMAPSIAASCHNLPPRDQETERQELEGIFPEETKKFLDLVQRALTNAGSKHEYKLMLQKIFAPAEFLPVYTKTRHMV